MIEDREIWACAHQVIGQYGEGAAFHAAQRADELLAANDMEGCQIWLRILRRIEDLERIIPDGLLQ